MREGRKPTLCLDFDGVIHSYEKGWQDGIIYGHAIPGFFEWAIKATERFELVVYSSRSKTEEGRTAMREWLGKESIVAVERGEVREDFDWGSFFPHIQFAHEKPPAFLTIDDRAITFEGRWDDPALHPSILRKFQTWTEKS